MPPRNQYRTAYMGDVTKRATRADVARLAGVSTTTVTFVLGNRYDLPIPEPTRERVRRAAAELGYQPNAVAKALVSGRTNAVTVAFYNAIVPYYARVLQAFERRTNAHGYHMIASTVGHISLRNVLPDLYSILNHPNDGVILVDLPRTFQPYIKQLLPLPKALVAMGIYDVPNVDSVEIDLSTAAAAAMRHLLDSSPKRMAFFGLDSAEEAASIMRRAAGGDGDPRAVAYVSAMRDAGLPTEVIAGTGQGRRANGDAIARYVAANGCPDAIFCYDDEHAISAHHCLRKLGYRLPDDVLLVGCDGNDECEYLEPALSTIVQPIERMCDAAWELMATRLANPTAERQHVSLTAELVVRESSVR